MKTTVVCGVLGAGKTTFIQNRLRETSERTAVLVNDFGGLGIDGDLLSADGIDTVELPSGCVCCTLRFDLIETIRRIREQYEPNHLVIEPSGVASPSGVLEALSGLGIDRVTVVGLVDATEFLELLDSGMFGRFFEDQITEADLLLVNKTDLAAGATVDATVKKLEEMNPGAVIVPTVNAAYDRPVPVSETPRIRLNPAPAHSLAMESLAIVLEDVLDEARTEKIFRELASGKHGNVSRAKGLIQTARGVLQADLASGTVAIKPFPAGTETSRAVIIGAGLDESGIRDLFA